MHIFCAHPEFSDQTRARCLLRCLPVVYSARTHSRSNHSVFASLPSPLIIKVRFLRSNHPPRGPPRIINSFAFRLRHRSVAFSSFLHRFVFKSPLAPFSGSSRAGETSCHDRIPSKSPQNGCSMKFTFISVLLQIILQKHVI